MNEAIWVPVAYAVPILIAMRPLAGHFAWTWNERERQRILSRYASIYKEEEFCSPSGDKWVGAYAASLCLLLFWPVLLLVLFQERHHFVIGAERKALIRRQREYIEKLEKELGLDA